MNILGIDHLLFGVNDVDYCAEWLASFGLGELASDRHGRRFAAKDGCAIVVCNHDAACLPPAPRAHGIFRSIRFAVADRAGLAAIGERLSRDRHIVCGPDGALHTVDDTGFNIAFHYDRETVSFCRREQEVQARTLTQITYNVPDVERARRFYVERLGFIDHGTHLVRFPAGRTTILLLPATSGNPRLERVSFAAMHARDWELYSPFECVMGWRAHTAERSVGIGIGDRER